MNPEIISIHKWIDNDGYRSSVIYKKNGIKHKVDFLSEIELSKTEIINQINENYEN